CRQHSNWPQLTF
nr:immunoglobulin light chain junction region [Macaca mulatta]MPN93183.1 immunoglobulin light chain junction region [Macaca mulatta]MPN95735.1 immunoglobulin light chain junction region [Macaca mulatta]MPN96971.1 immunoglobulin light chain junction region [Macaca mulatta]MPN97129.1 immunoglobulin light chain junction region [Macaca mulatta]